MDDTRLKTMNHPPGSVSPRVSARERLALTVWARCRQILCLQRHSSIAWVGAWQSPLNWPGFWRLKTVEILLEKNLSEERTILTLAHEAKQAALSEAGETTRNDAEARQFARCFFVQHGMELLKTEAARKRGTWRDDSA